MARRQIHSDANMQNEAMANIFENYRKLFFAMILVASMALGGLTGCAGDMGSTVEQPPPAADCPEGDLDCVEIKLREGLYY